MSESSPAAINLTLRPPRSPRVRLGGFVILPRILDKGRATLAGQAGEYVFDSPTDQHWLRFTGIDAEALKNKLAEGQGDGEILAWVQEHAKYKREAWEIQQWSAYFNERGPDSDPETLEFFGNGVRRNGNLREDIKSFFDLLDLDDYVSFGGRA
jgi:hypothetical protein